MVRDLGGACLLLLRAILVLCIMSTGFDSFVGVGKPL